jgi:type II secretion system (T2SS) protein M
MTLVRRIFVEKRAVALPLIAALLVNVLVYALVVYPLARRAAGAVDRAATAAAALKAAERDQAAALALVTGKARAEEELATFFDSVLPADRVAASRMTWARLPALARKANVRYQAGSFETDQSLKSGRVGRMHTRMVVQGDWENIRHFIYELETSPEFLIIDGVALSQAELGKPQLLTVEVSTYYRTRANGT